MEDVCLQPRLRAPWHCKCKSRRLRVGSSWGQGNRSDRTLADVRSQGARHLKLAKKFSHWRSEKKLQTYFTLPNILKWKPAYLFWTMIFFQPDGQRTGNWWLHEFRLPPDWWVPSFEWRVDPRRPLWTRPRYDPRNSWQHNYIGLQKEPGYWKNCSDYSQK